MLVQKRESFGMEQAPADVVLQATKLGAAKNMRGKPAPSICIYLMLSVLMVQIHGGVIRRRGCHELLSPENALPRLPPPTPLVTLIKHPKLSKHREVTKQARSHLDENL